MVPGIVVALMIAIAILFVISWIATMRLSLGGASLAKQLPPAVRADMKPGRLNLVCVLALAAVLYFTIGADRMNRTHVRTGALLVVCGLVFPVGLAVRAAWVAKTQADGRFLGDVLLDLSPFSLAGAIRLTFGLAAVMYFFCCFALIGFDLTRYQKTVGWLLLAIWAAITVPIILWTYLKHVDRVWLAERGLCLGGALYPSGTFERVAWSDDARVFALRRKGLWVLWRWVVVPVPDRWSREEVDKALRQVMPALAGTLQDEAERRAGGGLFGAHVGRRAQGAAGQGLRRCARHGAIVCSPTDGSARPIGLASPQSTSSVCRACRR